MSTVQNMDDPKVIEQASFALEKYFKQQAMHMRHIVQRNEMYLDKWATLTPMQRNDIAEATMNLQWLTTDYYPGGKSFNTKKRTWPKQYNAMHEKADYIKNVSRNNIVDLGRRRECLPLPARPAPDRGTARAPARAAPPAQSAAPPPAPPAAASLLPPRGPGDAPRRRAARFRACGALPAPPAAAGMPRAAPMHGLISARRVRGALYSGELEVQAKRKAIAVLQDEIHRILNASREMATLPDLVVKRDKAGVRACLEQISSIEDDVENLRRKITREVARRRRPDNEPGEPAQRGVHHGRDRGAHYRNLVQAVQRKAGDAAQLKACKGPYRPRRARRRRGVQAQRGHPQPQLQLGERHRARAGDAGHRARDRHKVQAGDDEAARRGVQHKEIMLIKDVIEGIEEMADKCQRVSDSFILLALSL